MLFGCRKGGSTGGTGRFGEGVRDFGLAQVLAADAELGGGVGHGGRLRSMG